MAGNRERPSPSPSPARLGLLAVFEESVNETLTASPQDDRPSISASDVAHEFAPWDGDGDGDDDLTAPCSARCIPLSSRPVSKPRTGIGEGWKSVPSRASFADDSPSLPSRITPVPVPSLSSAALCCHTSQLISFFTPPARIFLTWP